MHSYTPLEAVFSRLSTLSRAVARSALAASALPAAALCTLAALAMLAVGCTPSIGDKCSLSTDCSIQGDRQCDVAQPGGYCTVLNCGLGSCPEQAACVLFQAAVPGCSYDDRSVARTARSFCMAKCSGDTDCRDGYVCRNPSGPPWRALILEQDQGRSVCIPRERETTTLASYPDAGEVDAAEPAVCGRSGPVIPRSDASAQVPDAAADASSDSGVDAADAGTAADASGPPDGGDGGIADGGVPDAPAGGG